MFRPWNPGCPYIRPLTSDDNHIRLCWHTFPCDNWSSSCHLLAGGSRGSSISIFAPEAHHIPTCTSVDNIIHPWRCPCGHSSFWFPSIRSWSKAAEGVTYLYSPLKPTIFAPCSYALATICLYPSSNWWRKRRGNISIFAPEPWDITLNFSIRPWRRPCDHLSLSFIKLMKEAEG